MAKKVDKSALALRHLVSLAKGKKFYKQSDAAIEALMQNAKAGDVITLPETLKTPKEFRGKKFEVVDKFETRISVNVGMNARRFELSDVSEP